jgi:hypothetical protein
MPHPACLLARQGVAYRSRGSRKHAQQRRRASYSNMQRSHDMMQCIYKPVRYLAAVIITRQGRDRRCR